MTEWVFPNAIAESVRRTAELRGQHSNRLEVRDFEDKYPALDRVSPRERCPRGAGLVCHEAPVVHVGDRKFQDPFCRTCGGLVES